MRTVSPAPFEAVTQGRCNWGTYTSRFKVLNLLEAHQPLGFRAPRFWNRFRLKEWMAAQIVNPEWFICVAVYNTKSLGTAIIMARHRSSGAFLQYETKVPAWRLRVAPDLEDSRTCFHGRNVSIDFRNHLAAGYTEVTLQAPAARRRPGLSGRFRVEHRDEPMVILQPFGDNRPLYSHKSLQACDGVLWVDGFGESQFEPTSAQLIMDEHKGFYPFTMAYDWCTGCFADAQGRPVGFNLTDNQVLDHEKFNENCIWMEGRMHPLPPIKVQRPQGVMGDWLIRDNEGRVDLVFHPQHDAVNKLSGGIVKADYHGVFGDLEGVIVHPDGRRVAFDGCAGMGEMKLIRI